MLAIGGLYRIGIAGMRSVHPADDAGELARRFVHTLVPIALAYVVAHYFSLLVYQSQALAYLASDPLGTGSDYFGTATLAINYGVISATQVWYVQVAALLAGHIAGLILAHDKAIATYRDPKEAMPLPVLDAHRDGVLHESGALAALERRDVIARSGAVTRQLRLFA